MKQNIYSIFLLILALSLTTNTVFAQKNSIIVQGVVVEINSQQPVEFATVMVADKNTKTVISGTTTDLDGRFKIPVNTADLEVEISFIGFLTKTITEVSVVDGKADVGIISISEDSETLDEVVVRAEKSSMEFKLDKRVFNVGKDLSSTGASALELLNNVPSVNVNIEGQISLRGSTGVQILINGKPSILASEEGNALGTITAEMIEKIEVITNPSAKYEAEGTSGIINIVLKKEERKGINGSVSINTGIPQNHSIGLSLNRRTEKFNLFSQIGVGYRELPRDGRNINQNLVSNETIFSEGTNFRNENFYNFIVGTDYHINKFNVITLSGNFAYEVEDQPSRTDFRKTDVTGSTVAEWYREETTEATNPKYQYELQYKRDFEDDKNHDLLFSALGNFFGKDLTSEFENFNITGDEAGSDQQTRTNFSEAKYTFKLDYTRPFAKKWTLETGAQYLLNDVSNDFAVSGLVGDEWVPDASLTNVFEYDQKVLGVYGTGSYENESWGLKLGLRVENTDLKTLLVNTDESNNQNFTNLFPSAATSYKISERVSLQAGYSRRIFRPRLWDLNPFFNIRDNFNIRKGNPDLQPEFTDSYEISSIYIFNKMSFNIGVYHRYTTEVVERIATFENNVRTTSPENIGTKQSTGLEINGKYNPTKWFTLNGDFNYNYFNRQGALEEVFFDFQDEQWSSKMTAKFKLPADIDFEVSGQYQSKFQTVQGETADNLFANLGLRKKILKGKAIVNLSVRDVFASRVQETEVFQENNYSYSWGQRGRFVTLGFSFGFGKGEAMEFSGARRR
ncbi:MAG: outer membrane receptor protein involved in Fe transport [Paraglaciecola sp.]|jgi:outer membrane receptor protein involved in Fe transport